MSVARFGVSLNEELLAEFDGLICSKGYANRSEALGDLIRDYIVMDRWEAGKDEVVGTITLVYSHHTRELSDTLTDMQHDYHASIISTTHIHLDGHNCLEVLIVKGKGALIKKIAGRLIGTRGVKHGRLNVAATGKALN